MLVSNFKLRCALKKLLLMSLISLDASRSHPLRKLALRAQEDSLDYIRTNMPKAMGFGTEGELIVYCLNEIKIEGYYLEFGVYKGGTLRFMARLTPDVQFHGFDSFEGLPEQWLGHLHSKGAFSLGGKMPKVPANASLHKGWFNQSLPEWCQSYQGGVAFIHIDCDLYSSAVDVLKNLADRLQAGTIILFDEYLNYHNWENHEYRAWKEFVAKYAIDYEYIGFSREQVAVRIKKIGGFPDN